MFLIGVPLLCAEFCMGKGTRSNVFGAYAQLSGGRNWRLTGLLGILASLMILSFYSVVAGWTIEYCIVSIVGGLDFTATDPDHNQFLFLTTGWRPVLWTILFMICNFIIVISGVVKGIERASKVLMPIFFLLLVAFCINSFFMPQFNEGISYLFKPDFSKITPSVILGALGQAFFSLSLGLGCMMTYASYFSKETKIGKTAFTTALLDSCVAMLAGVIIFPAVFSFGISPQAGPTLVFEVLPYIFMQLPGGMIWSTLFFLLLFLASLTSTVSMSEISISYFCDERKWTRKRSVIISSLIALVGGILSALSFGPLSDFTIFGLNIFNLFDYASSNILLPLGGFLCSIFVGWFVKRKFVEAEIPSKNRCQRVIINIFIFFLRWICPIAIFLVFLNSIGII